MICSKFGCGKHLTLFEQLCGTKCAEHGGEGKTVKKIYMTLTQAIEQTFLNDREICFRKNMRNLEIKIEKRTNGIKDGITQMLPLDDHFTEFKIVECIKFMNNKLTK